jgi:hypothetical protein
MRFTTGFVPRSKDLSALVGKAPRTRAERETSCYQVVTYGRFGAPAAPRTGKATTYTCPVCNNARSRCFGTREALKSDMMPTVRSIALAAMCAVLPLSSLAQADDPMAKAARADIADPPARP